ncbi:parB-like partition protein [Beutenbergia cavernae DSM 12333]|uniref:ParB-like partition protein n=1 Tax=Beutenbergia cavernae (strain ATCC BAA-8 / DSM 12333 / CCUG 43141 / JCM 11478 / NBRC 16432 / NCIMB 13614 / HKI 0122) TaxID=471853 RepID=C5C6N1_BEUC1|nr:ParB/RepB/Spo0J family partition protein [Beutenbergia cavernae]ACQ82455.1 parB-like partition protein [Beutenbergia cavernae DSM 12333]
MSEKRRTGLGRGLGALIPGASSTAARPVDVFFPGPATEQDGQNGGVAVDTVVAERPPSKDIEEREPEKAAESVSGTDAGDDGPTSAPTDADTAEKPEAADEPAEEPEAADEPAAGQQQATEEPGAGRHGTEEPAADQQPGTDESASRNGAPTPGAVEADVPAAPEGATTNGSTAVDEPDDGLVPVPGATFAEIPVDAVAPNAQQPRRVFDEDDLEELAGSIREVGVLQPVVVRRVADVEGSPRYELIMGERRWRASRLAGNDTVPAIVRETADTDLLRDALLENLHRVQLNPLEEAAAYQQLLDDFSCTHDELASRISRSRPQISNTLRLLKLPPLVQRRVAAGVLSAGHARALLGLSDGAAMERLAQRIVAEGLSVRATEEIVALGEDEPMRPELRRRPRAGEHTAALENLGRRLSDRWDTKVKIALGQRKGRISIEFASVQDLNRILDAVAPEDAGVLREESEEHIGTDG